MHTTGSVCLNKNDSARSDGRGREAARPPTSGVNAQRADRSTDGDTMQSVRTETSAHHQTEIETVWITSVSDLTGREDVCDALAHTDFESRRVFGPSAQSPTQNGARRSAKNANKCSQGRFGGPYPAALECLADSHATNVAAADLTLMRSLRFEKTAVFQGEMRNRPALP